jgi:NDP-sugar pyrophosphorylase family protein
MKERITVTIERSLLRLVDASVDGMQVKNRSHAIELMIERGMRYQLPAKAVILAGGDPKELLKPINGRAAIQHNVDLLARFGVQEIIVLTPAKDRRVREFLGDGASQDIKLRYIEEETPKGTAGSLDAIRSEMTEAFFLLNGDEVKDVNLRDLYAHHKQQHGLVTIALTSVEDPQYYGVAMMNGTRIIGFVEKPSAKQAPSSFINAGLYVVEPAALAYIPRGFAQLETDVFPKLARDEKLIGFPFSGLYIDVAEGIPEKLTSLIKDLNPLSRS